MLRTCSQTALQACISLGQGQPSSKTAHLGNELLAGSQGVLLGVLGLGGGQGVQVKAQGADLATQLLAGLGPEGSK